MAHILSHGTHMNLPPLRIQSAICYTSHVCHDSLICVPWPWLNICVPWLTYMYATTQFLFFKKPKQRRGTYTNESRRMYEWVTTRIGMRHVTCMNESWHAHKWVTAHTDLILEGYDHFENEWVTTRIGMRHVTCMNELWHTYKWVTSQV